MSSSTNAEKWYMPESTLDPQASAQMREHNGQCASTPASTTLYDGMTYGNFDSASYKLDDEYDMAGTSTAEILARFVESMLTLWQI